MLESSRYLYGVLCDSVTTAKRNDPKGLWLALNVLSKGSASLTSSSSSTDSRSNYVRSLNVSSNVVNSHNKNTCLNVNQLRNSFINVLHVMVPTERIERLVQMLSSTSNRQNSTPNQKRDTIDSSSFVLRFQNIGMSKAILLSILNKIFQKKISSNHFTLLTLRLNC